ncbi:MAG TPA: 16S rRNA (cytosine(967)-C(5))-methyltransferase RsmB [Vicinamibacterales bacterium]|nr:16S rRNA (cytosine(967)-C(5))-methyltransferase RsmB [Vicinamibacterales bacterium]
MIAPARLAAYDVLQAVAAGRADLPSALLRGRDRLADERDRALTGEIATGTLRWQAAFDFLIARFAARGPASLDPEILTILRASMFQLLHLDRVPASAVVDDAVQMARRVRKGSAAGFVNALLRRVSRERGHLPLPAAPSSGDSREAALNFLSVTLSHPRWLVERWLDRVGLEQAAAWARFNNAPAALTLRANVLRGSRDALAAALAAAGVDTVPGRYARNALIVTKGNPLLTPLARTGQFVVQDEASQLVGEFAAAGAGDAVLDTCAAPGGKTLQLAAAAGDGGRVVAVDMRPRRVALLARTIADAGVSTVRVVSADARAPLPFRRVFDTVLVDAPCSGLGTIRRDPDVKWRRAERELAELASMQLDLLTHAAACVAPGGHVTYATCSSEPEENEQVVAAFLERHPAFAAAPSAEFPFSARRAALVGGDGWLRTRPDRDGLEAFFAARLVKSAAVVHS